MPTNNAWNSQNPAQVDKGGTGVASNTAYAVLCGGITSTDPVQSIASVGSLGQVLTSNGAGSLPTFQNTAGDITGPGSSTDNALVRWDGMTGTIVQDGVITEDNTGNLSISAAVSGASLSCLVANTSNTASATAFYEAQVAGSTASDAYYRADISGGQAWTWGLDNSDSDAFVISGSTNLGSTNIMRSSTAGEINYPLQPAFLGRLSSADTSATGNGTVVTVGTGNAFTEIFDQNGDFNTNGTFTAPVTGRYQLVAGIYARGFLAAHTRQLMTMITSNFPYGGDFHGFNLANNSGDQLWTQSVLADMDAGDTYTYTYAVYNGTKVINVAANNTFMCGYLAC